LQNLAARLIFKQRKRKHITLLLITLSWLPIKNRIAYKIVIICFKCIHGLVPDYLKKLIEIYKPKKALRSAQDNQILKKSVIN